MCIRDRSYYAFRDFGETLGFLPKKTYAQVGIGYAGLSAFCLLYTSDAADERSSVDLGGRRIIKKKNNNNS